MVRAVVGITLLAVLLAAGLVLMYLAWRTRRANRRPRQPIQHVPTRAQRHLMVEHRPGYDPNDTDTTLTLHALDIARIDIPTDQEEPGDRQP